MSYQHRLLQVLIQPVITEKAVRIGEKMGQVVFLVAPTATKKEIKDSVELLFKVEVTGVQVANRKGKSKRFGRFVGRRNHTRRAFVSLKQGQEINFNEEFK